MGLATGRRGWSLAIVAAAVAGIASLHRPDGMPRAVGGATFAASADPAGLVVTSLRSGGAAAAAGLRVGDVIDRVDDAVGPTPDAIERSAGDGAALLHVARRGDAGPHTLLIHPGRGDM